MKKDEKLVDVSLRILIELIRKSGVQEWNDSVIRSAMTTAAVEMANQLLGENNGN